MADVANTDGEKKEAFEMQRQRNTPQMKEQDNTPEKELNEMETNNL